MKSFGSLVGDDSEIYLTLRDEESKFWTLENQNRGSDAKSMKSSRSTLINDFSILSLNDGLEYEASSNENTSSNIHASSINSLSKNSDYKNTDEIIEVEVNDSYSQSDDQQKYACLFRKFIILGAKT
jgi:hypothetical protein